MGTVGRTPGGGSPGVFLITRLGLVLPRPAAAEGLMACGPHSPGGLPKA